MRFLQTVAENYPKLLCARYNLTPEEIEGKDGFDLLELVGRWAQPGDGVLYLNARDLQRLPQGFQEELERIAPQGKIALSPQPRQLESGFVLAYGPVELDCTFPALFQEAYDQLRDAAGAILFAPAGAKEEP